MRIESSWRQEVLRLIPDHIQKYQFIFGASFVLFPCYHPDIWILGDTLYTNAPPDDDHGRTYISRLKPLKN